MPPILKTAKRFRPGLQRQFCPESRLASALKGGETTTLLDPATSRAVSKLVCVCTRLASDPHALEDRAAPSAVHQEKVHYDDWLFRKAVVAGDRSAA